MNIINKIMLNWSKPRFWLFTLSILVILPWLFPGDLYRHILIVSIIHSLLALSLNLCTGFVGQLSLGHNGFMAIGAYTASLMALNLGTSFWIGLIGACLAGFIMGLIVGLPTLRVSGIYLGMVTLGMAEIIRLLALNLDFTRGPMGLTGIPAITFFGKPLFHLWSIYYVAAGILFLAIIFITHIVDSRIGDAFQAIRIDELAARAMGIPAGYYKVLAFGLSGALAGIAGAFYAHYLTFISPSAFGTDLAILILMMIVVGGLASIPGSLLGAVLLTVIPEIFRFVADYRLVIYGIVLVGMMVFRPQGILGQHRHLLSSIFMPAPPLLNNREDESLNA